MNNNDMFEIKTFRDLDSDISEIQTFNSDIYVLNPSRMANELQWGGSGFVYFNKLRVIVPEVSRFCQNSFDIKKSTCG